MAELLDEPGVPVAPVLDVDPEPVPESVERLTDGDEVGLLLLAEGDLVVKVPPADDVEVEVTETNDDPVERVEALGDDWVDEVPGEEAIEETNVLESDPVEEAQLESLEPLQEEADDDIPVFHPVFLGGINVGSGNKPPWTLPNKAKYSPYDSKRAKAYFGCPKMEVPGFFPILSLLESFPQDKYEASFRELFIAMFEEGKDVSRPELLAKALGRHFSSEDVKRIIEGASTAEYKKKLSDNTQKALDQGAFGCPWFWVRNDKGEEEPFFGSDRFHFMWQYLGIPFTDIQIVEKNSSKL
ncbi:Glutathione S-transferase kappa 1 [Diplodia seriata]|uniref:Glutathione S-transferase kappa 1 n=1 Tax=Diplodia seriata TaxID=420778 RepID=A0A1S8B459_9PEZI|nr:Glutathione S-transferase kappa 1 [Diplodia seriata]